MSASSAPATASRTSSAPAGSRLAVGSSSSSRPGRRASAPARARRCCSPPESAAVGRSRAYGKPTRCSASSTRGQISSAGTPRFSSPNATSSPQRAITSWVCGSWKTMPTRSRPLRGSSPSISTVPSCSPESSGSSPASAASRVLLPAPEGPSSSTRSPASIRRSTPRTAQARRPACRHPNPRSSTPPTTHPLRPPPAHPRLITRLRRNRLPLRNLMIDAVDGVRSGLGSACGEAVQDAGAGQGAGQQPAAQRRRSPWR